MRVAPMDDVRLRWHARLPRVKAGVLQSMMEHGLTLMVAGMGTVLLFLSIMVVVMSGTAWFFKKYAHLFPEEQHEESHLKRLTPDDSEEIAVIMAAIEAFRN